MSHAWLVWVVAGCLGQPPGLVVFGAEGLLGRGVAPDPNDPDPDPEPDPEPDPNDPDPTDPDPPPEPPDAEPPPLPEAVPPQPGDEGGDSGGEGDSGGDSGGEDSGDTEGDDGGTGSEVSPAPFAQLDVADRGSELDLGGDLTIGPVCKDETSSVCSNYRVGLRARLPVTQSSASGTGRAAVDSLNGFAGAWRVGGVFDWIRDVTPEESESPSKFYMLSLEAGWGMQTFQFAPDGGVMPPRKETRHSVHTLARFLAYVHPPRKTRVAPQVIVRYDRQWSAADPVGVLLDDGNASTFMFTVPVIIDGPVTTPVFAVTVPVLVSVQSGKGRAGKVLSQFGFGPAVSYAAAGQSRGYTPFDDVHVLRFESWIYWYPLGKAGQLAATKPNTRIGISPFVDVFAAGRNPGEPTVDFGVLAEVKVGVRGYEY
jgi:hypothetical protein